jgi:hypothetical protein
LKAINYKDDDVEGTSFFRYSCNAASSNENSDNSLVGGETNDEQKTPGFEIVILFAAISIFILHKRFNKKTGRK